MPVDRIHSSPERLWGLWKIAEDESSLTGRIPSEEISPALTNGLKRLEFLAGRVLIQSLLRQWDITYKGIEKDVYGKPFLLASDVHISLSHSYPFVAAILHRQKNVGIDLEQPKDKLLRIAPRILSSTELQDAGDNIVKHCVYWCAKETLIKIYGKKNLVFAQNLLVSPFNLAKNGHIIGQIIANNIETAIPLEYIVSDGFVVVVSD
jgi:4'-phosphopantetheinyl transferase